MRIVSLLLSCCFLLSISMRTDCSRETLEIGIGGGGGGGGIGICIGGICPLQSPPPRRPPEPLCPPPPSPSPGYLDARVQRVYQVIQDFRNTITCDPKGKTNTWVGKNICNYEGFHCANPPDNKSATALAAIDFNGFQFTAPTIENFVEKLPDLAFFHANSNNFGGTIPSGLDKLPFFYELDVSNNKQKGAFPTYIFNIKKLTFLDIRFNSFQGCVPPDLFMKFEKLEILFINNNNFMQPIPANLGSTRVKYLTLANNKFTGSIPKSIGQASKTLIEVLFLNNHLSGCLPYEIGYLQKATVFDAGNNWITGPIPFSFGCLQKVEQLNLARNLLYGQIPEIVCKLGSLKNLSLSDNYFSAVGPECRKLIDKKALDDRKNCIPGRPNQRTWEECTNFYRRAMTCPDPHSFYYIPCEGKYGDEEVSSPLERAVSPSPSYPALIP